MKFEIEKNIAFKKITDKFVVVLKVNPFNDTNPMEQIIKLDNLVELEEFINFINSVTKLYSELDLFEDEMKGFADLEESITKIINHEKYRHLINDDYVANIEAYYIIYYDNDGWGHDVRILNDEGEE
jgi:hypothetical protein